MSGVDRSKTIEQIQNDTWGEADDSASGLVKTIYALRKKRLDKFTAEDLRVNLLQGESVSILMPIALDLLENDPLASGRMYPGALLDAIASIGITHLPLSKDQLNRFKSIVDEAIDLITTSPESFLDHDGKTGADLQRFRSTFPDNPT